MKRRNQNENPFIIDKTGYHLTVLFIVAPFTKKKTVTDTFRLFYRLLFLFNSIITTTNFVFLVFGVHMHTYIHHIHDCRFHPEVCVRAVCVCVCSNRDFCILLLNFCSFKIPSIGMKHEYGTEFAVVAVEIDENSRDNLHSAISRSVMLNVRYSHYSLHTDCNIYRCDPSHLLSVLKFCIEFPVFCWLDSFVYFFYVDWRY